MRTLRYRTPRTARTGPAASREATSSATGESPSKDARIDNFPAIIRRATKRGNGKYSDTIPLELLVQ
jgi:hypothetical protein